MDFQADNFYLNGKFNNNFIKLGNISSGGYGVVIKARHLNKTYAIKLIPLNICLFERVMKEIKILSSLKSEYVIEHVSSWLEDNTAHCSDLLKSHRDSEDISSRHAVFNPNNKHILFVQMELGYRTLRELIKNLKVKFNEKDGNFLKPISYFIASEIFKEILECVNYLHNHSPPIIHRDLKPSNILITNGIDGRFVKIGDFGLATLHKLVNQTHTKSVGISKYMAPELLRNSKYDTKSDVYSLGVILQELFNFDFYGVHYDSNEQMNFNFNYNQNFHISIFLRPDIDPVLTQKYSKLIEITKSMLSPMKLRRPNCEEILNINLFMVESEIKNLTEIKEFLKPINYYTDNFFELLIQTKIKDPNYKLAIKSINKLSYFIETINNGRYKQVFEEISILGNGAFSVVCEAKSRFDNNFYAIKKIPIIDKSDNIKQIRREWDLMVQLKEDNFVKYISAWTEENLFKESDMNKYRENGVNHKHPIFFKEHKLVLYIQMELCHYTLHGVRSELNEILNPPNNKLGINLLGYYVRSEILLEIFDAIQFIHARNIIHRDLKPTNILISNTDLNGKFVKIADFGSAKLIESLTQLNTKGIGTPFYRAPEVFSGKYNTTADIYSLGLTTMDWFNTDISEYYF